MEDSFTAAHSLKNGRNTHYLSIWSNTGEDERGRRLWHSLSGPMEDSTPSNPSNQVKTDTNAAMMTNYQFRVRETLEKDQVDKF